LRRCGSGREIYGSVRSLLDSINQRL